jgi:hypothetical protein
MTFKLAQAAAALAATSAVGAGSVAVLSPLDQPAAQAQAAGGAGVALGRTDVREAVRAASRLDPGEVDTADIADGAVTSAKVRNGSLRATDFAKGQLTSGLQGPAGADGVQSFAGADGPVGPAGPQGLVGPQGPQGEQGPPGPHGVEGLTGPRGETGPAGPQGIQGPAGAAGPQGPAGPPGAPGPQGPAGADGATGADGAAGAPGPAGPQGPPGASGMSSAREVFHDDDQDLPEDAEVVVATMADVQPGSYVVFAKTTVVQVTGGDGGSAWTRCTLDTGVDTDYAETEPKVDRATLQTHLVTTLVSPGTITLRCQRVGDQGTHVARETKIIAIQVDTATSELG